MKTKLVSGWLLLVFILGCSSSQITHSWKSETLPVKKYDKIMVVGIIADNDRVLREKMENHLVGDLAEKGYRALSSFKEYGPKSFEDLKEQDVLDKLKNSGVDAVVTIVLLDQKKERYYVPGRVNYTPYNVYHHRFWGYYSTIYDRVYAPGYYQVDTKYFWESNLYDLGSKELIYSVQTESFDPSSTEMLAHEYGQLIVKNMVKQGALK